MYFHSCAQIYIQGLHSIFVVIFVFLCINNDHFICCLVFYIFPKFSKRIIKAVQITFFSHDETCQILHLFQFCSKDISTWVPSVTLWAGLIVLRPLEQLSCVFPLSLSWIHAFLNWYTRLIFCLDIKLWVDHNFPSKTESSYSASSPFPMLRTPFIPLWKL